MCVIFFIIQYDYVHGIDVVQFIQLHSGMKTEIFLSSDVNMTITSPAGMYLSFLFFYSYKAFYYMRHFLFNAVGNFCRLPFVFLICFFLSRISVNKSKRSSFYTPEICYNRQKDVYMYNCKM